MNRRRQRSERGASAVLVAFSLTAMMAVSALAVDMGQAYAERRHDQNTADAAVMSGLVEGTISGGSINDIVAEVRLKVDTTLGKTVTNEEWEACTDSEQLVHTTEDLQAGNPTIDPVTECISFSVTFDELRVKLPQQEVPGIFGPVVGFDNISVTAAANGKVVNGTGRGGPPFVALSTATTGDFVCLRTSSAKEPIPLANGNSFRHAATFPALLTDPGARVDPCHSSIVFTAGENFGTLKPWAYEKGCTRVGNTEVEEAVSIGIDHIMGVFAHGYDPHALATDPYYEEKTTVRLDGAQNCTVAYPNTFEIDEGLNAGGLSCALVNNKDTLCNGEVPRFQQGPYVQSTYKVINSSHDNKPPWFFMRPANDLYVRSQSDRCDDTGNTSSACTSAERAPDACIALAASRPEDEFNLSPSTVPAYDGAIDSKWDHYDRYDAFIECLTTWDQALHPELFKEKLASSARFGFVPQVAEESLATIDFVHIEGFRPVFMYRLYFQESGKMCDPADPRDGGGLKMHDAGQPWSCGASNKTVDRLASIILSCGMVPDTLCNKESGQPVSAGLDIYEFRLSK